MMKSFLTGFLLSLLILVSPVQSQNPDDQKNQTSTEEPVHKKKSHNWLIPVGAAAGFGVGLLVGFAAFDESINSDAKIWTTTAVCAGGGALLGWLFARHMDRPRQVQSRMQLAVPLTPTQNFTCTQQGSQLTEQANCMYPDYLRMGL